MYWMIFKSANIGRILIILSGLQFQLTDELNKVDEKLQVTEALLESKVLFFIVA